MSLEIPWYRVDEMRIGDIGLVRIVEMLIEGKGRRDMIMSQTLMVVEMTWIIVVNTGMMMILAENVEETEAVRGIMTVVIGKPFETNEFKEMVILLTETLTRLSDMPEEISLKIDLIKEMVELAVVVIATDMTETKI